MSSVYWKITTIYVAWVLILQFLKVKGLDIVINVKIKANSKKNSVQGLWQENKKTYLKLSIKAAAVDGKANDEIIVFLAKILAIPKSFIIIIQGEFGSYKQILLIKQNENDIKNKIVPFIGDC